MNEARNPKDAPPVGVFITKGMQVSVPPGGLVVAMGDDGRLSATLRLQTGLDVCPYWLRIAVAHVRDADRASCAVAAAREEGADEQVSEALEHECAAGMQAMMASAVALDAFYASVKDRVGVPAELSSAWRSNRTARYKQISEVLRCAFGLASREVGQVEMIVREVFRFRDYAVHPPAGASTPVLHPVLGLATDWRYSAFRFENARESVRMSLNVLVAILGRARVKVLKSEQLKGYCDGLAASLESVVACWESAYGSVIQMSNSANGAEK